MRTYAPGTSDGQIRPEVAVGVARYDRGGRRRITVEQEGDGGASREFLAAGMQNGAIRASQGFSNYVGTGDADYWLRAGEDVSGYGRTSCCQHDDGGNADDDPLESRSTCHFRGSSGS